MKVGPINTTVKRPDACNSFFKMHRFFILNKFQGNNVSNMENEQMLGYYIPKDGYWIHILDNYKR